MKLHTSILCLAFIFLISFASAALAQSNYLQKAYADAGASKSLNNIPAWRKMEKQAILKSIDGLPQDVKNELIKSADQALKQSWSLIRLSDYREFKENGNRVNYEHLNFARRSKLSVLCIGELTEKKGRYLSDIADGILLILEESTWVLPAHLYGSQPNGPDPTNPIIDLFSAETAAHFAWIRLLLAEELTSFSPVLMQRIDRELKTRIIDPYLATDDYWWMGLNTKRKQNNWNIWINSNVLKVAALAEDDGERRQALIEKVIRSADKFVDTYPQDGGCDEGPAYWSAAGGALGDFLNLLSRISGGTVNLNNRESIHQIGNYIYKVHIEGNRFVNFADAPGASIPDAARVFNFGELFNDPQLKSFAAYLAKLSGSSSRFLNPGSINVFANAVRIHQELSTTPAHAPMLLRNWLPDLQIVNLRAHTGNSEGLTFMAKGGNNGESHNHNDLGNFMLYMDGEPVLIDLGKGTYTKQTFSADRYKLWYTQSQWHNCPQINGVDQKAGGSFKATNVVYNPGGNADLFTMNLAGAYPEEADVLIWNREFRYTRSAGELLLKENYQLKKYKAPNMLSFVACKAPVMEKEGAILLPSFSGKPALRMEYNPAQFEAKIEEQATDDGSLAGVWGKSVYRITLKSKGTAVKGSHSIRFKTLHL